MGLDLLQALHSLSLPWKVQHKSASNVDTGQTSHRFVSFFSSPHVTPLVGERFRRNRGRCRQPVGCVAPWPSKSGILWPIFTVHNQQNAKKISTSRKVETGTGERGKNLSEQVDMSPQHLRENLTYECTGLPPTKKRAQLLSTNVYTSVHLKPVTNQ